MLSFGKYKGSNIKDIRNYEYIKYLSNYYINIQCINNNNDHICNEKCLYNIDYSDTSDKYLDYYLQNKEYYIKNWPNDKLWVSLLSTDNKLEKMKLIYDNRSYFYEAAPNELMKYYESSHMSIFYLKLYHDDIINQTRKFLKENNICIWSSNKFEMYWKSKK